MIILFLVVLVIVAAAVFANMTLYVAGALLGLLIFLAAYLIRRRKRQ